MQASGDMEEIPISLDSELIPSDRPRPPSAHHRSFRSRRDMSAVFGHDAGGIARHRRFPLAEPGLDFSLGQFNVQRAGGHIEDDDVAGFERRDGAFLWRFLSDMAGLLSMRGA